MPEPSPLPLFSAQRGPFQAPPDAAEELEGIVGRQVFASPDGEFSVLRLEVPGQDLPVTIVGALSHLGEGETARVTGTWEVHPQYGRRFRAQQAVPILPKTQLGVERYLSTLAGLGPETARRLVAELGVGAIEILENETWRVEQIKGVKGLGKRRIRRAAADAKVRAQEREVMVFLQGQGISAAYAARIRKVYGEAAMLRVRENPYRLAKDVPGIGFQIADRIARNMGVDPRAPMRIEAGILYTLDRASNEGHCYLPAGDLRARASAELHVGALPSAAPPSLPLNEEDAPPPAGGFHDPQGWEETLTGEVLENALAALCATQSLVVEDDGAYLPWLYRTEVSLARRLLDLRDADRPPVPEVPEGSGASAGGPVLSPGQRRALQLIAQSPVCVITGGPGTGKTTIIRALVRAWEGAGRQVLLAAPTGRAAKRLSEATGRTASTVHRLLEWAPKEGFRRRSDNPLEVDLLVCDEASMLDLSLARALAQAVPLGATLLLVGDVDQLPSVGPGRVLGDVIASQAVPVARLKEIFRQAEGSGIVENAHRILGGEMPLSAARGEQAGDFYFVEADDPVRAQELVTRVLTERIPRRFGLDPIREVQVLTPMHKGAVGTVELNRVLQGVLNPGMGKGELRRGGKVYRVGDKVMQIRNDYERDVWNGDVGVIDRVDDEDGLLWVRFDDDREVRYEDADLDQLELAYAVSVHKSQGSEYPAVVVPLVMQHYVLLRRNLLYTAVTRGKRLVVLVGSKRALWRAVQEQGDLLRYTRLSARLGQ
jgi:exodeoxyribonuclease V alpha subunit